MKTIKKYPTKVYLNKVFTYSDGDLFWKIRKGYSIKIGEKAGRTTKKGYWRVSLNCSDYLCHRLVWIMHNGKIPNGMQIDHINGIKWDNRIENLRLANNSQNKNNLNLRKNNKSGHKGVSWKQANKKWQVSIMVNGKNKYIGIFSEKKDAINSYVENSIKYHKKFSIYANRKH